MDQEISAATQVMKCLVCSFTHVKWSVVKVHISKVHTQGIKLNCDLCEFSCRSKSGMWKHAVKVHRTNLAGENRMEKNPRFDNKSPSDGLVLGHAGGCAPSGDSHAPPTSDYIPQTASYHPSAHDLPLPHVDQNVHLIDNIQASPMLGHSQHHGEEYVFPAPAIFNPSQPTPMGNSILLQNQTRLLVPNNQLAASASAEFEIMAQNLDVRNHFQLNRIQTTQDGKTMYSL